MVDAIRGESAGSGVSDRARAVGIAGGGRAGFESAGGESHRVPDGAAAGVRRMDGSAAILREFPHAVPRNTDGDSGAERVFPTAGTREGLERACSGAAVGRSGGDAGTVGWDLGRAFARGAEATRGGRAGPRPPSPAAGAP